MCIKRKKTFELQMDKISGARMTIEQQAMTLEGANVTMEAINAMKMGAQSMKQVHGQMSLDQIDNTMEDIREQMDIANELSDAISQPLGTDILDEDDLLAELEDLDQQNLDEQLLQLPTGQQKLPSTPTGTPANKKPAKSEEDELRELELSMAV